MKGNILDWIDGLDREGQRSLADRIRTGTATARDYDFPYEEAEQYTVRVRGKTRTLRWIVKHDAARLELLMDLIKPGSPLFHAVTLVYNKNLDEVLKDAGSKNHKIKAAGLEGLQIRKMVGGLKPRPIVHHSKRLFLIPGI